MTRVKAFGGLAWIVLLAVNLAVGWILLLSQRGSPEFSPIVLGIALLFNFPAGLLSLWFFGGLAGLIRADGGLADIFAVALIVVAYGLGYVQWFFVVPWLLREWKERHGNLAN